MAKRGEHWSSKERQAHHSRSHSPQVQMNTHEYSSAQYGHAKAKKTETVKYGKYTMQKQPLISEKGMKRAARQSGPYRYSTHRLLSEGE